MKKPIVKALACAMALTMALSSPVSALATEGIRDIFTTSEGKTNTGTGTGTGTDTKAADVDENDPNYVQVVGIEIAPSSSFLKPGSKKTLEATIIAETEAKDTEAFSMQELSQMSDDMIFVFEGKEYRGTDVQKALADKLTWVYGKWENDKYVEISGTQAKGRIEMTQDKDEPDTAEVVVKDRTTLLKLKNEEGNKWYNTPAYVTVRLGKTLKATAEIKIKWNAENIEIAAPEYNYVKHKIDLNQECLVDMDGNDELTWDVYEKNGSTYKKTKAATIANGVMTLKSATKDGQTLYLKAVGEEGKPSNEIPFEILKGQPINELTTTEKKINLEITADSGSGATPEKELKAAYQYKSGKLNTTAGHTENTTDKITWTSKNKDIATVEPVLIQPFDSVRAEGEKGCFQKDGIEGVKVVGHDVGKTTITGVSTSGKKITYTVTVTAPLQEIKGVKLVDDRSKIYSGQKIQLEAIKVPSKANAKITWSISNREDKKLASVSSKGILTAKKVTEPKKITVTATAKKEGNKSGSGEITIDLSPLTDIDFSKSSLTLTGKNKDKATIPNLPVGRMKTLITSGVPETGKEITDADLKDMLTWTSSKVKAVEVEQDGVKGKIKAISAGKANIKVSYPINTGKLKTKTITVSTKQSVTSIGLKQTDFTVNAGSKKAITVTVNKLNPKGAKETVFSWETHVWNPDGTVMQPSEYASKGITPASGTKKSAKVNFTKDVAVGTKVEVTAISKSGAKAKATITVCNPTKSFKPVAKTKDVSIGDKIDVSTLVQLERKNSDGKAEFDEKIVGCTVNNDNVRLVKEDDGKWYVYVLKVGTGSTKLTVKTASKSANITLKIK